MLLSASLRVVAAAAFVAAVVGLLAVSKLATQLEHRLERTATTPASAADRGDEIRIAMGVEPATLLGPFAENDAEINISSLIFPWLTNLQFNGRLEHVPGLASSWERSADGKTIAYHLKEAVWDDGKPILASDVVFTYRLVSDARIPFSRREYLQRIESVEAAGDRTVKVKYKNAYLIDNQLSDINVGVLPEHVYSKIAPGDIKGTEKALAPVGHGPFRVVSRVGARVFVLERNPKCVTTKVPNLKRAVFYFTATPTAAKNALLAGEIDAMESTRIEDVAEITSKGGYYTKSRGLRGVDFVAWNVNNPLFKDKEVRRALTQALDRDGLNRAVFPIREPGLYAQPVGTIPPVLERAIPNDLKPLPFDRKRAQTILDERGWRRGLDGIREKDGKKFSFTLLVNSETPRRVASARMAQQDLKEVGIDVKIDEMEFSALNKRMFARDFEAGIYGFQTTLSFKQGEVWSTGVPFNFSNYSNPKVDAIIQGMRDEEDVEKLRDSLATLQKEIYEDQPVTFLTWYARVAVVRERFHNFGASILAFIGDLDKCYVPPDLQKKFKGE
ncbi:MAG: hypothetical protein HY286_13340 [Planctomycetes bacterium]|nr:hypothetical protein [Planctomycetota bacterium]